MKLTIKAAANQLGISDKALYKRVKNKGFNPRFLVKDKGKIFITVEGVEFLKDKVRNNYAIKPSNALAKEEVAATVVQFSDTNVRKLDSAINDESNHLVISKEEYYLLKNLKDQVEFLKSQLDKQSENHNLQLDAQSKFYKDVLDKHIESSEKHIETMQEIVKNEQENTKALLDYEARSREVDDKLLKLRESMEEKKEDKKKKGLFRFFK